MVAGEQNTWAPEKYPGSASGLTLPVNTAEPGGAFRTIAS
jgi:hypothetical protein